MHWFTDEWVLPNMETTYVLPVNPVIFNYIKISKICPVLIDFSLVSHKSLDDRDTIRYSQANTVYPMIVSKMHNPHDLPYRMLDGRHRIHKLKEQNHSSGMFYIIPEEIVMLNLRRL